MNTILKLEHIQNLFFFGQITSKLATTTKTMTLICITLTAAVFLFIAAPVLAEWSLGYGAVVLMVICLTILSLQQLLDAGHYRYRFSVLRKLGVEEQNIRKLVFKQLVVWFGLPVTVAAVVSASVLFYFIQSVSAEISAYIGFEALLSQISFTLAVLILLLVCYFISTWILFQRSIEE